MGKGHMLKHAKAAGRYVAKAGYHLGKFALKEAGREVKKEAKNMIRDEARERGVPVKQLTSGKAVRDYARAQIKSKVRGGVKAGIGAAVASVKS